MKTKISALFFIMLLIFAAACGTSYKAKPLPFKLPASYGNAVEVGRAWVGAEAFADPKKAEEAFGFNVRGAGMLPVQVVFDNQGPNTFKIRAEQTFLEDEIGNLWPIMSDQIAYERATRYAQTKQIFKESAYAGFLGAAAGAIVGAAVGVVAGSNVGSAAGKGAAAGAAAGAVLGGAKGYTSDEARRAIIDDLNYKSLGNRPISPQTLAYGFIFFPGEAKSAKQLRLQLIEVETSKIHVLQMKF